GGLPDPATPWTVAGQGETPVVRALSWALLAPNPHNRQPWQVAVLGPREAVLYADPTRKLPATDPFERQITIGLGAFVELMRLAAADDGERLDVDWFPEGSAPDGLDARPVAHLRLVSGAASADPLFAHAAARRTTRGVYKDDAVAAETAAAVLAAACVHGGQRWGSAVDSPTVVSLNDLAVRAFEREIDTDAAYLESAELMRIGRREIAENPDGIALSGAFFEWLYRFRVISHAALRDLDGRGRQTGRDMAQALATARGHLWLVTAGNSRVDQVMAGASYLRANLAATGQGLAMQPLSQALQEYPEMAAEYAEAHTALGASDGETVQMWARIGYAKPADQAPRWALGTRLIRA
ncbi:MAG: twin-arginine translocation pathway signal protein, partial [Pseudomonadota bacterium]